MIRVLKRLVGVGLAIAFCIMVYNPMVALAENSVEIMQISGLNDAENTSEGAVIYEGIYNFESSPFLRGNNITDASLKVTPRSDEILVEVVTVCSFEATKIGVKNVYVQEKVWNGWKIIAYVDDVHETNAGSFACASHCKTAQKGKTYRVVCTHYAVESNGTEHIVENQSEEFVYN